ncbi:MAG TPA: hypothetical protein VH092_26265 [Urbifossiella sp.]|jgi:hypothetical protein|nr:hypothetical protein [Urbifossiella sp.]
MTCTEFRALLADHLGNELVVEIREKFETHRVGCEHCEFFLESYTHTVRITRLLPKAHPLPPGLEARLRAAVARAAADPETPAESARPAG